MMVPALREWYAPSWFGIPWRFITRITRGYAITAITWGCWGITYFGRPKEISQETRDHEQLGHGWQARSLEPTWGPRWTREFIGSCFFFGLYRVWYFAMLFKYMSCRKAYENHPMEVEARERARAARREAGEE